jgi:hypothetical protein
MSAKSMHPVLAVLLLILGGPFLAGLICLFWLIGTICSILLAVLYWPFRVLNGVALAVLGGGR